MTVTLPTLEALCQAGHDITGGLKTKSAMARALAVVEQEPDSPEVVSLLDQAWKAPKGHVLGLTGPPGVGKSTLISTLIRTWRHNGRTVGVIAVDPSSRKSGGALLGDRTRLATDPEDGGIFIRSMAARHRLGGLAALTIPAMVLMRAVYDIVLVETVGVGQSETGVVSVADTVIFCVQPGSGDSLQYMKAGIMEVPHLAVVTKSDMGRMARRARADVKGALGLAEAAQTGWQVPVLSVSASEGTGIDELVAAADDHFNWLKAGGQLDEERYRQGQIWLEESLIERFGRESLGLLKDQLSEKTILSPFIREAAFVGSLELSVKPH